MAVAADPSNKAKNKSRLEKKTQADQSTGIEKLKAVVRRLPPNLPEDIFWQSVQPWATDESVTWRAFYPGKIRKKYNKENIPSRAYIAFRSAAQLAEFNQAYDGHVFRDKAGNESYAVVEFAPSQKIPSEKRKVDQRMGTIEQDEDFISFIQSLKTPASKPSETDTIEALIAASQPPQQPKSTPLLEALRAEKQAQRDRETILKAHAHYRDRDKEELAARRKGKQPQNLPAGGRDEGIPAPGQGKRNRRGGGKRAEAAGAAPTPKAKAIAQPGPSKVPAKPAAKATAPQLPAEYSKDDAKDAAQDRRPRPAIGIGLASRHFDAALTSAGVLPADRKSRRERERERKEGVITAVEGPRKAGEKEKEKADKAQSPASPGRRGGRKRGDSTKSSIASPAANVTESVAIPSILPRPGIQPGILPRPSADPTEVPEVPASVTAPSGGGRQGGPSAPGEGRGGRRRGRGRGTPRGSGLANGS